MVSLWASGLPGLSISIEPLHPGNQHMKDSFGSHSVFPATIGPSVAYAGRRGKKRSLRTMILALITVAAVLVCSINATVAGANTTHAAGMGYLCLSLVMLGCALAFFARARSATGALHIRWSMIAVGALAASIGYVPSFTQYIFSTSPQRVFQTVFFNGGEALYLLAAVLFFAGVDRSIVLVDTLQALLFCLLRFNLVYSPAGRDHFTSNHLIVSQLMALFLLLVALVACLGAASRTEVNFLRTLSWFFGLRLISFFLSDQVSYTWLHYVNCSLWDVPGPVLLAGFSLYLLYTNPMASSQAAEIAPLPSSVTVRSLMPSFLALVNLMLGLFVLQISQTLAAIAISASLVCYVLRTALLQAEAIKDKALLQTRNEQLEHLAIRDPLTGIGNRRSLADVYSRLQVEAGGQSLSLLLMDIDQFKHANDRHGHLHGDQVLIALARKLESVAAEVSGSHCVRMGGDEFALLLPQVTPQAASTLAEELRAVFGSHRFETESSSVSLSVGIASLQAVRGLPLETLVRCADQALYRAKQLGRNRVEVQPVWEPATAAASPAPGVRLELQHTPS
jgi:diguanylate cyclase (GGDEF)-like protein